MPHDLMTQCENRRKYKVNGAYEWRWKEVPVSELVNPSPQDIRCCHCHGAVRLHHQQVEHGPRDHAEHRSHQDSEGCRGGHFFQGVHRMSSDPVI